MIVCVSECECVRAAVNADLHTAVVLLQKACVAAALGQLDCEEKEKCQHIYQRSALKHI